MAALFYSIINFAIKFAIKFALGEPETKPEPKPEPKPTITMTIDQSDELYRAARSHLSDCMIQNWTLYDWNARFTACPVYHTVYFYLDDNETLSDQFEGITITWTFGSKSYQVCFCLEHYDRVVHSYFPYLSTNFQARLLMFKYLLHTSYTLFIDDDGELRWGDGKVMPCHNTFDAIDMDLETKQILIDDLDRLIAGEDAKRGYLLLWPPKQQGGRNQVVYSMSRYLGYYDKYIFDLDMFRDEDDLKILMATKQKSILVCQNIHCSNESEVSLSRFLKFLDGLSSSCLEERIIVFTTDRKDEIDQSLLERHVRKTFYTPSEYRAMSCHIQRKGGNKIVSIA